MPGTDRAICIGLHDFLRHLLPIVVQLIGIACDLFCGSAAGLSRPQKRQNL
jgi:hypothetical protein